MAVTIIGLILTILAFMLIGGFMGYYKGYDIGFEDAVDVFEAEVKELTNK